MYVKEFLTSWYLQVIYNLENDKIDITLTDIFNKDESSLISVLVSTHECP